MKVSFEESIYCLVAELKHFEYAIQSGDKIWDIIFLNQARKRPDFSHVRVVQYQDTFYISHVDGDLSSLEVKLHQSVNAAETFGSSHRYVKPLEAWEAPIASAIKWMARAKKDWVKMNKQVLTDYPLNRRTGIVANSLIRESLRDIYRVDQELGKSKTQKFIKLVEQGGIAYRHDSVIDVMTANNYFNYCKIAYIAGKRKDDDVDNSLSGREMYERYADGRDEGLLEIAGDSPEEFGDWIDGKHPKKTRGGHPWEIKRGGNTTHIDLRVSRPQYRDNGYVVELVGSSIGRLKETVLMYLAIHDAALPIAIADPEGIRKRLLGQDNIGIVPCFESLHRANQGFPEHQSVYDVMYYDNLGRYKARIRPFITWEPLPLLKPLA